jgi:hypothetical protein
LNQPTVTAERFISNPVCGEIERLYRTGDRVRMRPDGNLEYLGRLDHQVKIAGNRIEPEEVESALLRQASVKQAAAAVRTTPSGEKQLIAFVVVADRENFSASRLKDELGDTLPKPMIPTQIIRVDALPLTPNGKIDRSALLSLEVREHVAVSASPLSGDEGRLADIWRRVLGRAVGPEDNFFDLGGGSLQLLEVHAILTRSLGREIPLVQLFENPTVRSLARQLSKSNEADAALAATVDRARLQRAAMLRRRSWS